MMFVIPVLTLLWAVPPPAQPSAPWLAADPWPSAAAAVERVDDRWFAEDKLQHFFMSFAINTATFSGARMAGMDRRPALVTSSAVTLAAGIGKEVYDARQPGKHFSVRDLVWDVAGLALAAVLLAETR